MLRRWQTSAAVAGLLLAGATVGRYGYTVELDTANAEVVVLHTTIDEIKNAHAMQDEVLLASRRSVQLAADSQRECLEALELMRVKARWLDEQLGLHDRFNQFAGK